MGEKPTYEELEKRIKKLKEEAVSKADQIQVSGINIEWNIKQGTCTFENLPVAMMWVDTTLAGLMSGVQAMVGTERFGLALQSEGRKSVNEDWQVISQFSDFRDGFKAIANIAAVAGWGEWDLLSLDEIKQQCTFRIKNSWEGLYQKALGVNWGSGMLAGKMAGYSSKLFKTNCWAEQTKFIAKGHEFDEFIVKPSNRSVESEIENLLLTDETTRADMAVALQKLQNEVLERKHAEKSLRESEMRYRLLADNVRDVIWTRDMNLRLTFVSPSILEQQGYTVEEAMVRTPEETWPRDSLELVQKALTEELEIEKEEKKRFSRSRTLEVEVKCKDGSTIWTEAKMSFLRDQNGHPTGIIGVTRDISDRKQAEESMRESEEKYRTVLEANPDPVVVYDMEGKVIYFNPAFTRVFGWTLADRLGEKMDFFVPGDAWRETKMMIDKVLAGERFSSVETIRYNHKGETIPVSVSGAIYKDKKGKPIGSVINLRDISQQKKLEAQLQQAQKMEAIGTMAGGIAHDFNNILSSVIGYTELALDGEKKGTFQYQNLQEVLSAGNRAKDLVKQILTFSRQVDQEPRPIQVTPLVKDALKMIRASIPSTVEIEQDLQCNALVMGDPTQIHQILLNLCTNAAHAMEDNGGLLTVRLFDADLDSDFISNHPGLKPGQYVTLTVTDTGHGISPDVMEKIFDPFFTTKEKGKGTGLGLSVVHGIVRSHGGDIYVYSEPGKGSTFKVCLPAIEKNRFKPEERAERPIPTGTERILFIDDEPVITNLGKQTLESLGYDVVVRNSSIEALELFKEKKDHFDLVITDMTMPHMTGEKLAEQLMQIRSDIPVILCTGFSFMIDEQKALDMGIRAFISKPILKREIAEAIRKVLDGNQ
jgi:PAS domain S-box-containing protein